MEDLEYHFTLGSSYSEDEIKRRADAEGCELERIGVERDGGSLIVLSQGGEVQISFLFDEGQYRRVF